ncbi:MAG: ammonium transporter [Lentisphaeria bacterium]|nr:ammonium transporter [Lentisphaeria bacterium]NQZ68467.1 ammonium transporter [Lentisphaeria bacterium]
MGKKIGIVYIFGMLNLQAGDGFKEQSLDPSTLSFLLICSALVFAMQAGFMCLECGMSRKIDSINVAVKNISDFLISAATFWIIGFGIMFGYSFYGVLGSSMFASSLSGNMAIFFLFQLMFCGAAATITSGAISGRAKFSTYIIMSAVISAVIYPIFGHWAWGGLWDGRNTGWLESLGFLDFAGSTVVHSVGGWVALAAVIVIGPRKDRYKEGARKNYRPSSYILVYIGLFILMFGWFGFNAGSNLQVDSSLPVIVVNTILAGAFGGLSALFYSWWTDKSKTPNPAQIANGVLGGLVGITGCCFWVSQFSSVVIGLIAGIITVAGSRFIEERLKIDDVVSAITVHGICGVWGTIATALFMKSTFLAGPRINFLGVQLLGILACFIWSFGISYLIFKFLHASYSLRVSEEDEEAGLNLSEHNISPPENSIL